MEILLRMKNVETRNGWYHYRKTVPKDVRQHPTFEGKTSINITLNTQDELTAKRRSEALEKEWGAKVRAARKVATPQEPARATTLAQEYIEKHIQGHDLLDLETENDTKLIPLLEMLGGDGNQQGGILNQSKPSMAALARAIEDGCSPFKWRDIKPLVSGKDTRTAAKLLLGMATMVQEALLEEFQFAAGKGKVPQLHAKIAEQVREQDANPPKPFLSEILKRVISQDTDRKTRMTNHIGTLIEWMDDKPVDQYSYDDLIEYRNDCLSCLPDRRKEKFQDMTLRKAIQTASPDDIVSRATIENHLTSIKTVFRYAVRHHGISLNTEQLLPKKKKTQHDNAIERRYAKEELQGMINLLPTVKKSSARFWVPLVSLYQGSRLNETCQLHTNDVRLERESGIWIFDFNGENSGDTNKRIKTDSSWRKVPVHPTLVDLGFVDFVKKRKQETNGDIVQLFHDVKWSDHHQYKRPVERWFNDGFRQKFLSEDRKRAVTFHSLRHTFAQQAQNQARMDDRIRRELGGWEVGETAEHYSGRHIAESLNPEIEKLDYGLDLSPIMGLY